MQPCKTCVRCSTAHLALLNDVVGICPGETRTFQQVHHLSLPVSADQILIVPISPRDNLEENSQSFALQQHIAVPCVK